MALWVSAAVYFLGDISAHFNPAVTLAFAVGREIEWTIAAVYFVVQIAAAIFGSFLAWMFFGTAGNLARTDPQPGQDVQAMFFEIILTFGLVLLVLGMANGPSSTPASSRSGPPRTSRPRRRSVVHTKELR